ncbi:hypothetical protein EV363DRAFT_1335300 [Boletus edulis]|nr:hypothetical protein EV363DRAFT_1335300 [Boletus edulis]
MVLMQEHGMHKGLLTPTIYPRNPLYPCYSTEDTLHPPESYMGRTRVGPDADKIPAKAMHGTHKGRLTPTIYPRNPWYSCTSMACTRVCWRRQYTRETHYTHITVPKTPIPARAIHGTHKGRPDADKIPAKPIIPMLWYRRHLAMIIYMGRTRVGLMQTRYPRNPCMERTRVG